MFVFIWYSKDLVHRKCLNFAGDGCDDFGFQFIQRFTRQVSITMLDVQLTTCFLIALIVLYLSYEHRKFCKISFSEV